MEQIVKYFRRHMRLLYTIITIVFCAFKGFFLASDFDTDFFITLVLVTVIFVNAYYVAIRKKHCAHNIVPYAAIAIVFVNRLYSYERLTLLFPAIGTIDPLWLVAGLAIIAIIAMIVAKVLSLLSAEEAEKNTVIRESKHSVEYAPSHTVGQAQVQRHEIAPHKVSLRPLWVLLILVCILVFTFLTFHLVITKVPVEPFNFFDTVTYLVAYSAAILVVLFAVGLTMTVIIEMIRFICSRIWLSRVLESRQNGTTPPLYVFSFIIVAILFYLSFRISGFTMDDFTDTISGGEYLALPLTILVIVTAFCLLVRITHGLILLVMDMNVKEIKNFFSRTAKSICLNETIVSISNTIVGIVLKTIDLALKFVKFIPDFFESMYHFTFVDEAEGEGTDAESEP